MQWRVPLTDLTLGDEEVSAVAEVLRSGWLTQGAQVDAFERAFSERLGTRHAIAVTNGTAALHLALAGVGLEPGDEFILPTLTFIATLNAGLYCGATPVLADCVSEDDLTISVEDVERKITDRTRVIIAMPYGGFCPDMEALAALADARGITLIEDACHAPLAQVGDRKIGTFGRAGAFSFFSNKNMTTGEGGMAITDDDALADRLRRMRSHGMTTLTWDRHRGHAADYDVVERGYNYRLDEVRAAIGLVQLAKLPEATERRCESAAKLRTAIEALGIDGLTIPFAHPRGTPVHHLFPILLPEGVDRTTFRTAMTERGIQTSVHYPLLHRFSATQELLGNDDNDLDLPVAEAIEHRLVTLPMGPHLDVEAVGLIAEAVEESLR
jgi:dTDP-4-amino-4,6-dideoxygalactose transaminase